MKKILLMTAIAAMGLGGCDKRPEPLKIDKYGYIMLGILAVQIVILALLQ